ncbi:putative fasciclin-like arabinogalactan protein 20, partial [Quercus suber]|uniref:putative fasciclin-like arabinogalactan protein 20 n=1 Tax=Quercus suber TaxID=58331 RepID=UPI0032DF9E05
CQHPFDSDYLSMALTLELVTNTLNLDSATATIFAPSDPAFVHSGQLPLLLVQYHILPIRLSAEAMKALPSGTSIPTLLPNCSLIVTASHSDGKVSINNVMIDVKAVYDDVFCLVSDILRSRGYSIMAAFLDAQLAGPKDQTSLTIFAPVDVAIQEHARNVSDYMLIFRQHVVPRLLSWLDLIKLEDGTVLPTFLKGFEINVTVSGDVPEFKGVPVIFLNMYQSRGLVVHGLNHLLTLSANQASLGDSSSDGNVDQNLLHHGDYH